MKASVVQPLKVSPLIKLSRWTFLIAGIYHGIVKHKEYSIAAVKFRAEEEQINLLKKQQLAREEDLRNQETARDLAEALTGLRVKFEKVFSSEDTDPTAKDKSTSINESEVKNNPISLNKSPSKDESTSTDESISQDNSTMNNDSTLRNDNKK